MIYYVKEMQIKEGAPMTAGVKARDDASEIFENMGYKEIIVNSSLSNRKMLHHIKGHVMMKKTWKEAVSRCSKGDFLILQFPAINHTIFLKDVIKDIQKRGTKIILLVHDMEMLRTAKIKNVYLKKRIGIWIEEKSLLNISDKIIVHNRKMKEVLANMGIRIDKMVELEIFDYLIPGSEEKMQISKTSFGAPIVIAGTLRPHKAQYSYHLPKTPHFNLYGVGYEKTGQTNIVYHGAFLPDDLPFKLVGSFGLVWDGEAPETCTGVYGEYLKINNPHKTSLYLASGLPVIIWKEAALAEFIEKRKCGIVVNSLNQINGILGKMSEKEYKDLEENTACVAEKLRKGQFTKSALEKCINTLM